MSRSRRDRERAVCPSCGRTVTVRRDGGLMAHSTPDRTPCVPPAWKQRAVSRCADCGELGELTGHMECQYPGRVSDR